MQKPLGFSLDRSTDLSLFRFSYENDLRKLWFCCSRWRLLTLRLVTFQVALLRILPRKLCKQEPKWGRQLRSNSSERWQECNLIIFLVKWATGSAWYAASVTESDRMKFTCLVTFWNLDGGVLVYLRFLSLPTESSTAASQLSVRYHTRSKKGRFKPLCQLTVKKSLVSIFCS